MCTLYLQYLPISCSFITLITNNGKIEQQFFQLCRKTITQNIIWINNTTCNSSDRNLKKVIVLLVI